MNFVNTKYLPHIILAIVLLAIFFSYLNLKYFRWIKTYWFFERSWMSRIAAVIYMVSIALMLISLLDLRGPEQKIKSELPDQKTIIILDSSTSMFAEDVRPNRFGKAIQLARHFVKNAAGHQVSIVLFSDLQKRLIPFTDDIDLLDSRLAALEKTNAVGGGSNISQAIVEAVGYFGDDSKTASGNILVFTDAEESEDTFDVDLGTGINLAVVGVGTAKGSNIPLRWEDGSFRGYKMNKNEQVITKLDENYIKKLGKNVKNYKYWIANSYSLPTEEIMNFFRSIYNKTNGKGDMRVRPVFSHLILIPAIILYCISIILGRFKSFKTLACFLVISLLAGTSLGHAQDDEEKKPKPFPPVMKKELDKVRSGKADRKEVLKVAENLLRNNDNERASELYKEYSKKGDEDAVNFNRATAFLKSSKIDEAMPIVQSILKNSKDEKLKDQIRHNLLMAMNNENKDKNGNKEDNKENSKEDKKDSKNDKKDEKNSKNQKDGEQGEQKKDDKKSKGKDSKDTKSAQNPKDQKDPKEDSEKDKKPDPKDLDKPERPDNAPKSLEEKEKMIEQKRKMVKTPAMVKQILNDDRELQKRMMNTSTNERGSSKQKRDW